MGTCACLRWWYSLCKKCHEFVENIFEKWGRFVYNRTIAVIVSSLIISLILMAGFIKYSVYGQAERLFYPQNSQVFKDLERVKDSFDYYVQNEEFILFVPAGKNILDKETFKKAYEIHEKILSIKGFHLFCKITLNNTCASVNPFDGIFPNSLFNNVSDVLFRAMVQNTLVMSNGLSPRRNFPSMFGKFRANPFTRKLESNVIRIVYPVKFASTRSQYDKNIKWEAKMIELLKSYKSELQNKGIGIAFNTVRGIDDSLAQNTKDNFSLITVSIGSMVLFCVLGMINFRAKIKSHILIGLSGIFSVIFGIGAGFGLGLFTGQPYVGFIGVLPFLVLGIGIDDMFIIVHHLDQVDPSYQGPDRLGMALRKAGFSILMTTLTDVVAFIIGTVSMFPAVRIFCVFAFLSVTFSFLMIISFFVACLSLDMKRIKAHRWDCLPCVRSKNTHDDKAMLNDSKQTSITVKVMTKYGIFLTRPLVKMFVVIFASILLALGIYSSTYTSLDFDYKISGSMKSSYIQWIHTMEQYFHFGIFQMDVVLDEPNVNYTDPNVQLEFFKLNRMVGEIRQIDANKTINWMTVYTQWAQQQKLSIAGPSFYTHLQRFLSANKDFYSDLKMDSIGVIKSCRVHFFTKDKASWLYRKDAVTTLREELTENMSLPFYAVSFTFIYLSHLVVIIKATLTNVGICSAVILLLTLPFVVLPQVSVLLLFTFLCFLVELLGVMYIWDLSLNSVTMIVLVMAVGFAVDYSCHVVHGYLNSKEKTPNKRLIDALVSIGISVLKGAFSTLIGILVLSISDSKLFRLFFKMMFTIVVLGIIHGMIILPVFLTLFVKTQPFRLADDDCNVEGKSNRDSQRILLRKDIDQSEADDNTAI